MTHPDSLHLPCKHLEYLDRVNTFNLNDYTSLKFWMGMISFWVKEGNEGHGGREREILDENIQ